MTLRVSHCLVLATLAACGGDALPEIPPGTTSPVAAVPADTVTVNLPLTLAGQVYVEHDAAVVARTSGIIQSVLAEMGSPVREGQLMAQLENEDQKIAHDRAQSVAANAERILARSRVLAESGYVARADSEQARHDAEQARLALRKAERDLELTRITAPFSGLVTSRAARPSRMVQPGDSLFRITAMAPLLVSVRIPESAGASVTVGSRAQAIGVNGRVVGARVVRASPAIDPASGTREVILRLDGDRSVRPGTTVTVRLGAAARTVVAIPRASVTEGGFVMVIENGRAATRAVQLGADLPGDRIEVITGLEAGEMVASPR